MELQFYPPGWTPRPVFGFACDARKWCAALTIDSLSVNPVHGTVLNAACASLTGLEYVNFAFITKKGRSQAPANPVESTVATFTPDAAQDLFMNSGDRLVVSLHDTAHGLQSSPAVGSSTISNCGSFSKARPSSESASQPPILDRVSTETGHRADAAQKLVPF
jgi:hypothetical protein